MDEELFRQAKRLRNNPAFEAVLEALERDALGEFKSSAPDAPEVRERAYNKFLSLYQIKLQVDIWADQAP